MMNRLLIFTLLVIGSYAQTPLPTSSSESSSPSAPLMSNTSPPSTYTTTPQEYPTTTGSPTVAERECGCTISKIWLDIVAVIDNSLTMTQEGISQIQATLSSTVHQLTLNPSGGYASRIGIVTFNDKSNIVANLTRFSNTDDFMNTLFSVQMDQQHTGVNILE